MNDIFKWTAVPPRRPTRRDKKRSRRKEKNCRKIMVHYAGNCLLPLCSEQDRKFTTAEAKGWSTRRAVKVPRSLRRFLGLKIGGPPTWAQRYKVSWDMAAMIAQFGKNGETLVAADDPSGGR